MKNLYSACHTSKDYEPYVYGVSGPGPGLGYHAWLGYPQNTFSTLEEAEKVARLMNIAFAQGQAQRGREIKALLE
jgi:hypothetical protein